jgi:D-sedoheptulose 7-phosphate isomerase
MDLDGFFTTEMDEHLAVAERTREQLAAPFAELVTSTVEVIRSGGKLLLFGNGGSAADAHNIATEFLVRYKKDRVSIAAIGLTTDGGVLTAIGNDLGFDQAFARQIEGLGKPGDLAVGISTSGRSPNVIEGLKAARAGGLKTAVFGGGTGGDMMALADHALIVPSTTTARIQEMHILLGQMLCGAVELEMGLVAPS